MVWDEAKREAARQRMAHATAVRMAKRNARFAEPVQDVPTATLEAPQQPVTAPVHDLVLTIRRIHVGSFSGLWELGRVNADGTIKIVTDANTKAMVINMARNEILKLT